MRVYTYIHPEDCCCFGGFIIAFAVVALLLCYYLIALLCFLNQSISSCSSVFLPTSFSFVLKFYLFNDHFEATLLLLLLYTRECVLFFFLAPAWLFVHVFIMATFPLSCWLFHSVVVYNLTLLWRFVVTLSSVIAAGCSRIDALGFVYVRFFTITFALKLLLFLLLFLF